MWSGMIRQVDMRYGARPGKPGRVEVGEQASRGEESRAVRTEVEGSSVCDWGEVPG